MSKFKRMFTLMLALALVLSLSTSAFAAEVDADESFYANAPATEESLSEASTEDATSSVQPRGVLSGYGCGTTFHSGDYYPHEGEFWFDVTGSWSGFAGCTIKTEGFADNDWVLVKVYDEQGNEKVSKELVGASDEIKNILVLNVTPGRWHVTLWTRTGMNGRVHCWIY